MTEQTNGNGKRQVHANFRVILDGYAVELEADGTLDEMLGLAKKMNDLGIQPGNSPLLWPANGQPVVQPAPNVAPQQATPQAPAQPQPQPQQQTPAYVPVCPVHGKPMKKSQYSGYFCTSKNPDGTYCDQKVEG